MSRLKRAWKIGDEVTTTFSGKETKHKVIGTKRGDICESGLMILVSPPVPKSGAKSWIDANWFEPSNDYYGERNGRTERPDWQDADESEIGRRRRDCFHHERRQAVQALPLAGLLRICDGRGHHWRPRGFGGRADPSGRGSHQRQKPGRRDEGIPRQLHLDVLQVRHAQGLRGHSWYGESNGYYSESVDFEEA